MFLQQVVSGLFWTQILNVCTRHSNRRLLCRSQQHVVSVTYLAEFNVTDVERTNVSGERLTSNSWPASLIFQGLILGWARFAEILQNCVAHQVFGRMCSIFFLAFTLKLPIQTLLFVAPTGCTLIFMACYTISAKRAHSRILCRGGRQWFYQNFPKTLEKWENLVRLFSVNTELFRVLLSTLPNSMRDKWSEVITNFKTSPILQYPCQSLGWIFMHSREFSLHLITN